MTLAEKLRHLRDLEGRQRGLGRALTQAEVVAGMRREVGASLSQAYLSQLEGGRRGHLSPRSRHLLAAFFKVHPGYLVSDPEGYQSTLSVDLALGGRGLGGGALADAAEALAAREPVAAHVLLKLSRRKRPDAYLRLFDRLVDLPPERVEQLVEEL